ncbi:hypothetical protein Clo1100_3729 [Clostridium sp. BNL1100]|nr:hypothetical protein Clo1100_3729 [Clostridium sp. BNL1100]
MSISKKIMLMVNMARMNIGGGKLIKIQGKNHKLCKECSKENEKKSKREWWSNNH